MARRGEFALIGEVFAPLAASCPAALGLGDDAAVLDWRGRGDLVVSADALVCDVHFLADDPPDTIARKCLRTNLSDMAAMGAKPVGVLLTAALSPALDDAWMEGFARGLGADLADFSVGLLGGDTVSTPGPAQFSITILGSMDGHVPLTRSAAQVGDDLWVSGTLGDGALGLRVRQGQILGLAEDLRAHLVERYRLPRPRVGLGLALRGLAHGCMDISDGLCADAGHLCAASRVGLVIDAPALPLSEAAATVIADHPALFQAVLGGGDDYELLFTAAVADRDAVAATTAATGVAVTRIGEVVAGSAVDVRDADGKSVAVVAAGWSHGE
ncbi:thiamine-monophosphate kinase [Rhodospirillum rubrum F11]|uniref:Thiamine-monophosphate kinase n=2 Tax=Rhodospirillum rubrum TaxID=1085 RepID=Q2RTC5_RHORT|nr:thiamine-phosphate kinase [Rhodospirillum rubrum]ABC22620.1 Thiamine-monophosphate kinase [Rhodospirillum rubrum ATCC 11170]AEO48338.1 thiamine-monophosphate kinase [Rhodospirillum rubrum F11]MBK5954208.1 thiamine-phosphate kinase [Rhodospirillum rubrum]QXG82243.1 thiamine-phosphate kinase [Rhodospirillum rubrum]HCF17894.1 thiamine-phosphate kinase [Rhodospirillum rubrum]